MKRKHTKVFLRTFIALTHSLAPWKEQKAAEHYYTTIKSKVIWHTQIRNFMVDFKLPACVVVVVSRFHPLFCAACAHDKMLSFSSACLLWKQRWGGGEKEKKAKQQSPNFSLLCFLSTHRFEGKHFSAFWNSNVYVLPRQRAYRSVQTTEFKAWTWVFFFFYVVPCYVAFFVRQPIPPSLVVVVVALELFNPHSFWKIFSVLFLPFVILRISLRRRHTNKWFVSYASVKTFLLFSHCCRCFFFRWRAAKKNGRKETKMGRCCVIRTVCVFRYRREGKKEEKSGEKKTIRQTPWRLLLFPYNWSFSLLRPIQGATASDEKVSSLYLCWAVRMLFYDYFMV